MRQRATLHHAKENGAWGAVFLIDKPASGMSQRTASRVSTSSRFAYRAAMTEQTIS
jgi:hypothetical protein